jgi:hypothetical protein
MKTTRIAFPALFLALLLASLLAASAQASDHGYVTSEPEDHPGDNLFRVNVQRVNGKESESLNTRVPTGENTVTVSLVFNSSWGNSMEHTQGRTYSKDLVLQVEKGKTYFLGAKVDTKATPEAQRDGSFWEPVVVETKGR